MFYCVRAPQGLGREFVFPAVRVDRLSALGVNISADLSGRRWVSQGLEDLAMFCFLGAPTFANGC